MKEGRGRIFTKSPLGRPQTHLEMLANHIGTFIYFPIPDPLYVMLATIAANMLKGSPVWLVLIGAPSSGRTMLLEMLSAMGPDPNSAKIDEHKRIHVVGAFKTAGALLSASVARDIAKGATGGLLRQIGTRGLIVMKDFTSMLSLPHQDLIQMIAALREIFDGLYSRPVGADGGKNLIWKGRVGFMAASTPAIDQYQRSIGELGERWIYYRYLDSDGYGETMKALSNLDNEVARHDIQHHIVNFFEGLSLSWANNEEPRPITAREANRFWSMATVVCAVRSAVPRDKFTREIIDRATKEGTTRLSKELAQLYLGMERIQIPELERWRLIGKIALDSARQLKMSVVIALWHLRKDDAAPTPMQLRQKIDCGARTIHEIIDDLRVFNMVEFVSNRHMDGNGPVRLTAWAREQLNVGWRAGPVEKDQIEEEEE